MSDKHTGSSFDSFLESEGISVQVEAVALQRLYEAARKLYREQWAQSDEEDWCARKEVEPGTYKWLGDE